MGRFALVFPTREGKSEADIKSITAYFRENMDQYRESRRRAGSSMERVYLQPTPMGNLVVAYVEADGDFPGWVQAFLSSDLEADRRFVEMVADIHGVDLRQPGPPPETVGEWVDSQVKSRKKGLAFAAPLVPGKIEAGRAFAREAFVQRESELAESRRALSHNVEVVTINQTPMGDIVCVYLEGDDPVEGNRRFAASTRPYDTWFKERLAELFPPEIDFSKPVPPVEQFWDWTRQPVTA